MSDANGCEVKWYLSYYRHLGTGKSNFYLDFGTLVHTGLAYFYAARMERKPEWYLEQPSSSLAMENDCLGHENWLRNAEGIMKHYEWYEAGDPWNPLYNEEEFEVKVGEIDPDGPDEPAEDIPYKSACKGAKEEVPCNHTAPHLVDRILKLPTLNEELVTCRPDLIIEKNGHLWIIDHKTQGGAKNGSGRLPVVDDRYPDYRYYWQAMVNLWIVRNGRCASVPGVQKLDIQGFIFNRIKRDIPYDVSRDLFPMNAEQYAKVPREIRECVREERRILRTILKEGREALNPHHSECGANGGCSYVGICFAESPADRLLVESTEFIVNE